MQRLALNPEFTFYFGLFLVKKDEDDSIQSKKRFNNSSFMFFVYFNVSFLISIYQLLGSCKTSSRLFFR